MSVYVDTSVLVAFYVPEPLSDEAEEVLRGELGPAVSDLTDVELFSALTRKVRGGELSSADASRVRALYASHLEAGMFTRKPFKRSYFQLARDWLAMLDLSLRSLDSLHLAAASFEDLELVTADRALARAAAAVSVDCRLLLPGAGSGSEEARA